MNKVLLSGFVQNDVQLKSVTRDGKNYVVTTIRLGVPKAKSNQIGLYIDIVFWNELAERASKDIKTKNYIEVEGTLVSRKYDKDNITIHKTEVIAGDFKVVSNYSVATTNNPSEDVGSVVYDDDDVPF